MTTNQRDILAGALTAVYLIEVGGLTYDSVVDAYEYYRKKISEEVEKDDKDQ